MPRSKKILDDDHNFNLQKLADGQITADAFLKIDEKYIADSNALKKAAWAAQLAPAMKWETLIQDSAFSILKNAVASQAQYTQASLERSKTFELNNQSLTSTQKQIIQEKYRVKEGKAKQKEFKQEQGIDIAKAVMSGAKAVVGDLLTPEKIPF